MQYARKTFVALALVAVCGTGLACRQESHPRSVSPELASARATAFLLRNQSADGAWRSETHGIVRGGAAWTPYIVGVLRAEAETGVAIERALDYIRSAVDEDGALGRSDPDVLEYPNYSTAFGLMALTAAGDDRDVALRGRMRSYLLRQQWNEARGLAVDHPAIGGWGFGEVSLAAGTAGHVDLSHTRRALEAIEPAPEGVSLLSQRFLALAQKLETDDRLILGSPQNVAPFDGGFYASPVVYGTNKAGIATTPTGHKYFRSYATATCDGIMALLAAGVKPDDARIEAALEWLLANDSIDKVAGIPEDESGQWEDVMYFYHLNARAEVLARLSPENQQLEEIESEIIMRQAPDGSYSNVVGAANKEDDPLLATAFALSALRHASAAREAVRFGDSSRRLR